jgi:ribonuclease HII
MRNSFRNDHTPLHRLPPGALVGGMDEVAMGPLAGPLIACVTVFRAGDEPILGVTDSKQLTEAKRESLRETILARCSDYGFGQVDVEELDEVGLGKAHVLALTRALGELETNSRGGRRIEKLYVDGNKHISALQPAEFVVRGDARIWIIGAASILAKQEQCDWMMEAHKKWPEYGFAQHHGYGTPFHLNALEKYGPCPAHRKSVKRVKKSVEQSAAFKSGRAARRRRALNR